jgi:hypothetical protein
MKIKMWLFCALISVLVATYSLFFAEDFEEGVAAYNKGDYTTTNQIFLKEAQKGNVNAQCARWFGTRIIWKIIR